MASVSSTSMEGTFNYLLQPSYLQSKSIKFNGRKATFGWRSSSLRLKNSVGGLGYESRRSVCFKYNWSSSPGIKWKRSATGTVSSSLQSALDASVSVVYDASSKLKSRIASVLQGRASAKRAVKETNTPLEPIYSKLNNGVPVNFMLGLGIIVAFVVIALRRLVARQLRDDKHGSVSDLVKRGQLRSDRRVIPSPLKYDDPFNNPLVKMGKRNSTVKMYGKVFRLTPVTLTREKALSHQNRRVRAYQWKRPTVFLKEGEPIPPGVDPDTVRWIPANHPFATATNDIDEDFAQKNIYQTRGVPSRVRAEHEALKRKMEIEATKNDHMSTPAAENPHGSENQSKHPDSLEKACDQPSGDSCNGDLRKIDRNGDSFGCQKFEENKIQDAGLRPVNHTTQFLEISERQTNLF